MAKVGRPGVDLTGQVFGRLTVTGGVVYKKKTKCWTCQCSCGNTTTIATASLVKGLTRSCGCLANELSSMRWTTHGLSQSHYREYMTWAGMIARCTRPHVKHYHRYGGRGIRVCDRWLNSFANFLDDMGDRPSPRHSLDRIDNDGNYEPGNCRWATVSVQSNNRRDNRRITALGRTQTITEWATQLGVTTTCIKHRLNRGIQPDIAVSLPPTPYGAMRRRGFDILPE